MRWEYCSIYADFDVLADEVLDRLGQDGWELLTVAEVPKNRLLYRFRRLA
jgi:hypothetical protein